MIGFKCNPSIGQWRNFYMKARRSFSTLAAGSHTDVDNFMLTLDI
jgi:hypothetical protein